MFELAGRTVWVAGHGGIVGAAIVRRLKREPACHILTVSRQALDLRRQGDVEAWLDAQKPDVIILAAARVGGIVANQMRPAEFLYDNLMIAANVIHGAARIGVDKLLFLGSSCIYPRDAEQPIDEGALLSGPLEPTNEAYAIAKIAGVKMCQTYREQFGSNFISAMPANLYGPGDTFDLQTSHVIPALIRKAHEAKLDSAANLTVWGSGQPRREFLYVDDLADACVFLLQNYFGMAPINVGSGDEVRIADLARLISDTVGFDGDIAFDLSKPDGPPRKLLESGRLNHLGWRPRTDLKTGLEATYAWFLAQQDA